MEKNKKRITLIELINRLHELRMHGVHDDLPVVINSDVDDYLYDIQNIRLDTFYSDHNNTRTKFISIDIEDNPPVNLAREE